MLSKEMGKAGSGNGILLTLSHYLFIKNNNFLHSFQDLNGTMIPKRQLDLK